MLDDDKSVQKEIVTLAKAKDFTGLLGFMRRRVEETDSEPLSTHSAKLAINISANLLMEIEPELPLLDEFHRVACVLIERFPSLSDFENIDYALIKTKVQLGAIDSAVQVALACKEPRLRLFSVIIEHCGKHQLHSLARSLLYEIEKRDLVPSEADYGNFIKSLNHLDTSSFLSSIDELLVRLADHHEVFQTRAVVDALASGISQHGIACWDHVKIESERVGSVCGFCPVSNVLLHQRELSNSELEEMIDLTRQLSVEASELRGYPDTFDEVISAVQDRMPTVILDAANIAHTNQNFDGGYFRFDQIEDIMSHYRTDATCLVVIHEKWLNPNRELKFPHPVTDDSGTKSQKRKRKPALPQLGETAVEGRPVADDPLDGNIESVPCQKETEIERKVPVELIEKWRENGELLIVPHGQNDDWFWMHICLLSVRKLRCANSSHAFHEKSRLRESEVILVSNDQMRDHFWRMKNPKFFARFRANHVCGYTIKYGEDLVNHYDFHLPIPFSVSIQKSGANKFWHIPFSLESEIQWFAFQV